MPKLVYQIFLGAVMFSFVAVACNNKKEEKKDPPPTEEKKPAETPPATPPDSISMKPTETGN